MARKSLTADDRAASVKHAVDALPSATATALYNAQHYGPNDPRTLRAWEIVETHGATVHRQSRLLAGKSRGG
jgi:hypothetical protein